MVGGRIGATAVVAMERRVVHDAARRGLVRAARARPPGTKAVAETIVLIIKECESLRKFWTSGGKRRERRRFQLREEGYQTGSNTRHNEGQVKENGRLLFYNERGRR